MPQLLVAVADSVFPNLDPAREVLSKIGAELRLSESPKPDAIVATARQADGLLVTYAKITAEMIRQMTRCRIISRFGIGVDNVDIDAATEAGIVVTKVPDYCIDEVSDHAMALLLAVVRKIPFANARAHAGRWEMPAVVPIHRLRGSTLGLVVGLSVSELTEGTIVANLGYDKVVHPNPLFHGDTVYAETQVLDKRDSASRPD